MVWTVEVPGGRSYDYESDHEPSAEELNAALKQAGESYQVPVVAPTPAAPTPTPDSADKVLQDFAAAAKTNQPIPPFWDFVKEAGKNIAKGAVTGVREWAARNFKEAAALQHGAVVAPTVENRILQQTFPEQYQAKVQASQQKMEQAGAMADEMTGVARLRDELQTGGFAASFGAGATQAVLDLPKYILAGGWGTGLARSLIEKVGVEGTRKVLPTLFKVFGDRALPLIEETSGMLAGFTPLATVETMAAATGEGKEGSEVVPEAARAGLESVPLSLAFGLGGAAGRAISEAVPAIPKPLVQAGTQAAAGAGTTMLEGGTPEQAVTQGLILGGVGLGLGAMGGKGGANAEGIRSDQGRPDNAGDVGVGGQDQGGANLQRPPKETSGVAQAEQQASRLKDSVAPPGNGVKFGPVEIDPLHVDGRTGLPNNTATGQYLSAVPADHWLVRIDGDNFKAVNDRFGHPEGDKVLKSLGDKINQHFPGEFRGREGGEEFLVDLGPGTELDGSLGQDQLARLRAFHDDVGQSVKVGDGQPFTLSVGVARGAELSDRAVYKAKENGRNQIALDIGQTVEYYRGKDVGRKQYVVDHDRGQINAAARRLLQSGDIDAGAAERIAAALSGGKGGETPGGSGVPAGGTGSERVPTIPEAGFTGNDQGNVSPRGHDGAPPEPGRAGLGGPETQGHDSFYRRLIDHERTQQRENTPSADDERFLSLSQEEQNRLLDEAELRYAEDAAPLPADHADEMRRQEEEMERDATELRSTINAAINELPAGLPKQAYKDYVAGKISDPPPGWAQNVRDPIVRKIADQMTDSQRRYGNYAEPGMDNRIEWHPDGVLSFIREKSAQPRGAGRRRGKGFLLEMAPWNTGKDRVFEFDPNSTDNEGRFRLRHPDEFQPQGMLGSRWIDRARLSSDVASVAAGVPRSWPGVRFRIGRLKDGKAAVQAVMFDKARFNTEAAAQWWRDHAKLFGRKPVERPATPPTPKAPELPAQPRPEEQVPHPTPTREALPETAGKIDKSRIMQQNLLGAERSVADIEAEEARRQAEEKRQANDKGTEGLPMFEKEQQASKQETLPLEQKPLRKPANEGKEDLYGTGQVKPKIADEGGFALVPFGPTKGGIEQHALPRPPRMNAARGMSQQVRSAIKRWLAPQNIKYDTIHPEIVKREGAIGSALLNVGWTAREMQRAARKAYGRARLTDEQARQIDRVLKGEADLESIPREVAWFVADPRNPNSMRNQIDVLSQQMIDLGIIEGPLVETFTENMGYYATRSYRIFEGPAWVKKVLSDNPEMVRKVNAAKAYIREELSGDREAAIERLEDQAKELAGLKIKLGDELNYSLSDEQVLAARDRIAKIDKRLDEYAQQRGTTIDQLDTKGQIEGLDKQRAQLEAELKKAPFQTDKVKFERRLRRTNEKIKRLQAVEKLKEQRAAIERKLANPLEESERGSIERRIDTADRRIGEIADELERVRGETISEDHIEGILNELLFRDGAPEHVLMSGGMLGKKSLDILTRRKDIPPEIRALWGEYENADVNYAKSVAKMSQLIANAQFLREVAKKGLDEGWLKPDPEGQYYARLGSESSKTYDPLAGLYATEEFKQALHDAVDSPVIGGLYGAWLKVNATMKYAKTIGNPLAGGLRNVMGNVLFLTANGHVPMGRGFGRGVQTALQYVAGMPRQEFREYIRHWQELGALTEGANAGELRAIIKDATQDNIEAAIAYGPAHMPQASLRLLERWWSSGDFLPKIIAIEKEMKAYEKAIPDMAEREKVVADIVRRTLPTYSMAPMLIQRMRRFPVLGTFVTFPAEALRTAAETIGQGVKEIRADGTRQIGARRLVGVAATAAALAGLQQYTAYLAQMNRKKQDALREFLPPWAHNNPILFLGQDARGRFRYIDLGYTDPHGGIRAAAIAALRGEDWEEKIVGATTELMKPWITENMVAERVASIMRNKRPDGRPVWSTADRWDKKIADAVGYAAEAVTPGAVTGALRVWKGYTGEPGKFGTAIDPNLELVAQVTGVRVAVVDPRVTFLYSTYKMKTDAAQADAKMMRTEGRDYTGEQRARMFEEYGRKIHAARMLGMDDSDIMKLLLIAKVDRAFAFSMLKDTGRAVDLDKLKLIRKEAVAGAGEDIRKMLMESIDLGVEEAKK